MPEGIEKIVFNDPEDLNWDNFLSFGHSDPATDFIIRANKEIRLRAQYYADTPLEATKYAFWVKGAKRPEGYTSADRVDRTGDDGLISIKPKFCGPKEYIIEAFTDEPTNAYPKQLTFRGYAPEKIVETFWSLEKGGDDIRQDPISYGDEVWLRVTTEGLNGARVTVEIYDYTNNWYDGLCGTHTTECLNGEINLKIDDTYSWRNTLQIGQDKFYIKIKKSSGSDYIKDEAGDDEHARYLRVKNEVTNREVAESTTARPAVIEENEVNFEKYEICRFEKITVTDADKDIVLFDQGSLAIDANSAKKEFGISASIHFDSDKAEVRAEAANVLDGIARLLLDNPRIPVELGAHCDHTHSTAYNNELSWRRANASVEYLVNKGVAENRIQAHGFGENRAMQPIDGFPVSEEQKQSDRRVTIEFLIYGADAKSILFDTIAGDKDYPVDLKFKIDQFKTNDCVRIGVGTEDHTTHVRVKIVTIDNSVPVDQTHPGASPFTSKVFSDLSQVEITPISYIWPSSSAVNLFEYHIHSCRYYAFPDIPTVVAKVYPDIKWDFHLFLNLTNDLSVKWQGLSGKMLGDMQSEAGKLGAESRWKQTEIDFGVILQANWNKTGEKTYGNEYLATVKFESKIKKLYEVFSALKDVSKHITGKTKGKVAAARAGASLPFSVVMKPPNMNLGAEWKCSRGEENENPTKEIGTEIKFYLNLKPLIRLEIVIDLLDMAITAALAVGTGGAGANPAAISMIREVRAWLSDEDHPISVNMYIELVLFGEISAETNFIYHTNGPNQGEVTLDSKVGIIFRAGLSVRAAYTAIGVEFYALGEAGVKGEGSITFGHQLKYVQSHSGGTLDYVPRLLFDGIKATVTVKAEVGMSIRKRWFNFESSRTLANFEREYDVVDPFDILEVIAGDPVSVTLIGE